MRVTWSIDIFDATSAQDAARKARAIQLDPDSTATVFTVDRQEIDLMECEDGA